MNINLEYYKIFYYVGKFKNITLAAGELSLSQPAVSQAVKNLEKSLGSTLFIRTSKGVRLTDEGEVLYSFVKRGYESILLGEKKLQEMQGFGKGEIRIGASDMTLQFYLLSYLERFHEAYPGIRVKVTNAPTPETLHNLQDGQIDFGVVSTPFEKNAHLTVWPVKEIEDIFVAGSNFSYLKGMELEYKELEKLPIMCLEGDTSTRRYVEQYLREENVYLHPEFELATSEMLVQFAERNLGVASVVKDFAEEKIEEHKIFQLQFKKKIPERQFCVVTDQRVPLSSAAEQLLRILNCSK
ncbi:MAG: LysR family transcriptional regulator [Lachnospiraceae bacterium]|uniref:LysR family transcriptional regulator n=1 Tax=Roseburia hominis TaxID=301301 RepID=UPI001F407564|nr:LysR family transcriptional regulator [Roseburia hominis]MCI5713570.1 LysR family transcriptional regulator [Lachnospiraceae bacterium]MDY4839326.1 LysR family transcriptional regulator [Lachnospiraceae bacterium]